MSELDAEMRMDMPDREEPQSKPSNKNTNKSDIDIFCDYVNHSRSPACICSDGRLIKPNIVKGMLKSFKKKPEFRDFNVKIATKYSSDGYDEYIIHPKFNGGDA